MMTNFTDVYMSPVPQWVNHFPLVHGKPYNWQSTWHQNQLCLTHGQYGPKIYYHSDVIYHHITFQYLISGVLCQKQESRAGTSNYIPQYLWDVVTCPALYTCFQYNNLHLQVQLFINKSQNYRDETGLINATLFNLLSVKLSLTLLTFPDRKK